MFITIDMTKTKGAVVGPKENNKMRDCKVCGNLTGGSGKLSIARSNANDGCLGCKVVVLAIERAMEAWGPENWPGSDYSFSLQRDGLLSGIGVYIVTTNPKNPWPNLNRDIKTETELRDLPDGFTQISNWISECSKNHPDCHRPSNFSPSRLIDIGISEESVPKLCSGSDVKGPYCALSHCWGTAQPLRALKANLAELESGILYPSLSKTFRDAITVCRELGIQYLWIDSLCIIQDDNKDWEEEASKMASIYSNAHLVIAATAAKDGSGGLHLRNMIPIQRTPFYSHVGPNGNVTDLHLRKDVNGETHLYFTENEFYIGHKYQHLPLLSRTWVLQERLLARRVVHFASNDLIWQCRNKTICQCGCLDSDSKTQFLHFAQTPPAPYIPMKKTWNKELQSLKIHISQASSSGHVPGAYIFWHKIIVLYMSLQLSFPSDCFPALSGIAQEMTDAGAGEYAAGLWKKNIFADLLWFCHSYGVKRPKEWRAPSWSWASIGSGVYDLFLHALVVPGSGGLREFYLDSENLRRDSDVGFRTTLVDIDCTPLGPSPLGQLSSASLTIKAPFITVSVTRIQRFLPPETKISIELSKNDVNLSLKVDCNGDFHSDEDENIKELFCIWIGSVWKTTAGMGGKPIPYLMVLRRSRGISGSEKKEGAYERVGLVPSRKVDGRSEEWEENDERCAGDILKWFEGSKVESVMLV